ncbi:hypothetical protein, partial [Acinetobacter baumannii]
VFAYYVVLQPILFFRVFPPGRRWLQHASRIFLGPAALSVVSVSVGLVASLAFSSDGPLLRAIVILSVSSVIYL